MGMWDNVEWHDPIGRTVYIPKEATPCIVTVHFDSGMPRELYFDSQGRTPVSVEVSVGASKWRFIPAREIDDCEVIE